MPEVTPKSVLRSWISLPRPVLLGTAALLCVSATLYAIWWMANVRSASLVELGFNHTIDEQYDQRTHSIFVADVVPGSPAEQMGLRAGDHIIAVNGRPLITSAPYDEAYAKDRPGDPVEMTVERPGEPNALELHGIFRARPSTAAAEGLAKSSAQQIVNSFPVLFLLVGFAVLFLRLDDPGAWLLAVMFTAFAAAPDVPNTALLADFPRDFALAYRAVWAGLLSGLFYLFFAVFPRRSPLDRRLPWLKWAGLLVCAITVFGGLRTGKPALPYFVTTFVGMRNSEAILRAIKLSLLGLGMVSLALNAFGSESPLEARRKSRVIFWGTVFGVLPIVTLNALKDFGVYDPSYWVNTPAIIMVVLYPLSFAYAVVKHRVLDIPVLLRRSVRYLLVQRGYLVLLFFAALLAIFLFTRFFSGLFAGNSQFGMGLSAAFGVAMVWVSGPLVKKGTDRIDRAFFRSAYDARRILQDLAEKIRTVTDRHELAQLLEVQIEGALHPKSLACYLETSNGALTIEPAAVQGTAGKFPSLPRPKFPSRLGAGFVLKEENSLRTDLSLLEELARLGKSWEVPPPVMEAAGESNEVPECLVPIVGRNSRLVGMLVLGPRLSEEPYSGEDKSLLESVASQAAVALENISLAEQMAERLERDRRAEHEMQIARDVQSRLLPQAMPKLETLEYAGECLQARQVGGDYYDFVDLGSSRVAFVLADISGKGIAGALLMANLQANLRSRYEVAVDDLPHLLKSVNKLFYANTPDDRYATLFLGVYDENTRQLTYANCGQNPPLLFRAGGDVERLRATATVIGLFRDWQCGTQTVTLRSGDVLVIYTDGVTEANDAQGNEFGEQRLVETVRHNPGKTPADLIKGIQAAVQRFSVGEQFDDLTLVVACAR